MCRFVVLVGVLITLLSSWRRAVCFGIWVVGKQVKLDCAQFVSSFRVEVVGALNYFDGFPDDVWDSRSDLSLGCLIIRFDAACLLVLTAGWNSFKICNRYMIHSSFMFL